MSDLISAEFLKLRAAILEVLHFTGSEEDRPGAPPPGETKARR